MKRVSEASHSFAGETREYEFWIGPRLVGWDGTQPDAPSTCFHMTRSSIDPYSSEIDHRVPSSFPLTASVLDRGEPWEARQGASYGNTDRPLLVRDWLALIWVHNPDFQPSGTFRKLSFSIGWHNRPVKNPSSVSRWAPRREFLSNEMKICYIYESEITRSEHKAVDSGKYMRREKWFD